jgi:hypothetical protein
MNASMTIAPYAVFLLHCNINRFISAEIYRAAQSFIFSCLFIKEINLFRDIMTRTEFRRPDRFRRRRRH